MEEIYLRIRRLSRQIVSRFPLPDFYNDFSRAHDLSRNFFENDPVIARLREFVEKQVKENFGHGIHHAVKVAIDAGMLLVIEGKRADCPSEILKRRLLIVQCASLLHDIKRIDEDHAVKGADFARELLKAYPVFKAEEIDCICQALRNHEAFKSSAEINSQEGILISDCLYDADKFRWGPDNFNHTIWDMLTYSKTPLSEFFRDYKKGMNGLAKIKLTFRTKTGKKYGPQFIDTGITVGNELYEVIRTEFADYY